MASIVVPAVLRFSRVTVDNLYQINKILNRLPHASYAFSWRRQHFGTMTEEKKPDATDVPPISEATIENEKKLKTELELIKEQKKQKELIKMIKEHQEFIKEQKELIKEQQELIKMIKKDQELIKEQKEQEELIEMQEELTDEQDELTDKQQESLRRLSWEAEECLKLELEKSISTLPVGSVSIDGENMTVRFIEED